MSQNVSSAVMQQRVEPHDSLDDFPTPPFATRALLEHIIIPHMGLNGRRDLKQMRAWDPACNRGYMVRPLREYFMRVHATDVYDYGCSFDVADFLWPRICDGTPIDWVITNPPFRLAKEFIFQSMAVTGWRGTAMLVRTAFLEGGDRYRELFALKPPTIIAQFAERVIMTKGIVRDPSKEYWDDAAKKMRRPSTATAYCWLVWMANCSPKPFHWIPPCRTQLERDGDYA